MPLLHCGGRRTAAALGFDVRCCTVSGHCRRRWVCSAHPGHGGLSCLAGSRPTCHRLTTRVSGRSQHDRSRCSRSSRSNLAAACSCLVPRRSDAAMLQLSSMGCRCLESDQMDAAVCGVLHLLLRYLQWSQELHCSCMRKVFAAAQRVADYSAASDPAAQTTSVGFLSVGEGKDRTSITVALVSLYNVESH